MRQRDQSDAEMLMPVAASGVMVPNRCENVEEKTVKDQMVKNTKPARSFLWDRASWRAYAPIGKYQVTNWMTASRVCHGISDRKLARMNTFHE
jgi:hypothetical protein